MPVSRENFGAGEDGTHDVEPQQVPVDPVVPKTTESASVDLGPRIAPLAVDEPKSARGERANSCSHVVAGWQGVAKADADERVYFCARVPSEPPILI